jgi:hypothetical protein
LLAQVLGHVALGADERRHRLGARSALGDIAASNLMLCLLQHGAQVVAEIGHRRPSSFKTQMSTVPEL